MTGVRDLLGAGERFVYAYYEGIDKVAHAGGLGGEYDDELRYVDRMVGDVLGVLGRVTQGTHAVARHAGPYHLMVVERDGAPRPKGPGLGLAHIVEERSQAQDALR